MSETTTTIPAARFPRSVAVHRQAIGIFALFAILAVVPLLALLGAQGYILAIFTRVLIFAIAALSLDILVGYGGLASFGHAAFLGLGSYAVGILSSHGYDDLLLHLAVAMFASAVFALATSAISLRTTGVYYIMSTLAFGQMLFFVGVSLSGYGGDDGMSLPGRSRVFGAPMFASDAAFYYLMLGTLMLFTWLGHRLIGSRVGRVLCGARENPQRTRAIGLEPFRYQLIACMLAGTMCGVAGVLLANQAMFVSPAYMTWQRSGDLLIIVLLGGAGTLIGPILGAAAYLLLEEWLSGLTEQWKLIFGPMLVLTVLFARGGIMGLVNRFAKVGRDGSDRDG
jgi:branched-chain amino acid transport system permease protein